MTDKANCLDIEDGKFCCLSLQLLKFWSEIQAQFSNFSLEDYAALCK